MAKTVSVLQPRDVALLRKASAALTEFLASMDPPKPTPKATTPHAPRAPRKRKRTGKPTGAAAHKANLAKKAAAASTDGGGKTYPEPFKLGDAVEAKAQEAETMGAEVAGTVPA